MKFETTWRGFGIVRFIDRDGQACTIQASSAIGTHKDAYVRPGSCFLRIGPGDSRMHVDREQVSEIIQHLQAWLETGSLEVTRNVCEQGIEDGNGDTR